MQIKKVLAFASALVLCCSNVLIPQVANLSCGIVASAEETGSCGTNATYSFDESTGTLTISGTGVISVTGLSSSFKTTVKHIDIQDGITTINAYTFNGYSALTDVTIPSSVVSIGMSAFNGCSSLATVYFGGSKSDWTAINFGGSNDALTSAKISYNGESSNTDTKKIDSILDTVELKQRDVIYCYDCSSSMNSTDVLYTYRIKDSDKQILQNFMDENFTDDMSNTEKIIYTMNWLHNNITYTLSENYGTLSNSLAECGFVQNAGQCLQYNGALAYLLAYMGYDVNLIFLKNGSWQHFTCQVRIDGKAYRMEVGNKGLDDGSHYMYMQFLDLETDVNVPDNTVIGQCGNSATYSLDLSSGVLTISGVGEIYSGDWYDYADSITAVVVEDGITSIDYGTFYGCTSLKSVTLADSVTYVESTAFEDTPFLANLGEFATLFGSELYRYTGDGTNVEIPDTITSIGSNAFLYEDSLESVTIPSSVTAIKDDAFYGCYYLSDIYFQGTKSQWNAIDIADTDDFSDVTIHFTDDALLGDVNEDSQVDATDLLALKKHILYVELLDENSQGYANADINADGQINVVDMLFLKKSILGMIDINE